DHIKGNPNAELVIVEYSDTECPFCKRFHETMQQVIDEYGKSGKVAWVYRHFPLEQLHAKARSEAEATECAAELGGNTGFWKYLDELFRVTPSNDGLPAAELAGIAGRAGLDRAAFEACRASGRHAKRVQTDYSDAVASGGSGTPWSIILAKDGKKVPINGAQPYETVKQTIDALLKKI
ncbi:MAG: thioredoxin domain-containing protein, partial [Patescibacteria group bacterium]